MNNELTNQLFKKYPTLFPGGKNVNMKESLMCFGFECGDGWYNLIDKLCSDILKCEGGKDVTVEQVKEKFGGLRFYTGPANSKIFDLIHKAEEKSFKICEECGAKGELEEIRGWYTTLCKKCKKKDDIEHNKLMEKYKK